MHHRAEDEAHVGLAQQQRRHDLRRVQRLDPHRDRRMLLAEDVQRARQHLVAERQHRQDAQLAHVLRGTQVLGQALHLVELAEEPLDVRVQGQRLVGGHQPAPGALEQRKPQLQLGMLQRAADRRLGDVDQPCRGADAAGEHDRVEDLDVAQPHGRTRCRSGRGVRDAGHARKCRQTVTVPRGCIGAWASLRTAGPPAHSASPARAMRSLFQYTSSPPPMRFRVRASTKSRSDSRLR